MTKRDYSLLGPEAAKAEAAGLAAAQWYHSDVPRREMKALMQREDQPAIRDTIILFGAMMFTNPEYLPVMYSDPMGQQMILFAVIWSSIGIFFIRRICLTKSFFL